jgi:hypothetical protein
MSGCGDLKPGTDKLGLESNCSKHHVEWLGGRARAVGPGISTLIKWKAWNCAFISLGAEK